LHNQLARIKILTAGISSLILMLGIARFAYTPMLPIMQQQAGLGISEGGWLAAINYIGYFGGAILASQISNMFVKDNLYRVGLAVAVFSTLMMGLTDNFWIWSVSRFFAGFSSAAGLLIGSGLIMNWLFRHEFRSELGIHFAGLGLGIAFCSLLVELTLVNFNWQEQWYLMTLIGLLLLIPAWFWLPRPENASMTMTGKSLADNPPSQSFLRIFMLAYFCAGVGYVVSATFIVAIVEQMPALEGKGQWTFLVIGLAAAPAPILWDYAARWLGDINALILAYFLKVIALIIPVLNPGEYMIMLSAALFGASFMGIVSLVLSMSGRYYPSRPAKMMGKMTIAYGVAQIVAPAITGVLAEYNESYMAGLYLAVGMMIAGTILMLILRSIASKPV
jgi:predicted MFS family arabinose efflux permease